jgi:hypothetical protein
MNIQEELNDLMEDNGVYANLRPAPKDLITEFTGKLPEFLLELWKQHGFGSWSNGLYHVCNPHDFDGLLSQVFHADEDFSHKDCHVFGHSAFGGLHVWSEKYGIVDINLTSATLRCINLIDGKKTEDPSLEAVFSLSLHADRKKSLNIYDDNDKPLFARARKRLGDLEPGECYGFFPALAMGGAPRLENLKRTKALEHFLFLAQLQQFTLMDYLSRPIRAVRMIG